MYLCSVLYYVPEFRTPHYYEGDTSPNVEFVGVPSMTSALNFT